MKHIARILLPLVLILLLLTACDGSGVTPSGTTGADSTEGAADITGSGAPVTTEAGLSPAEPLSVIKDGKSEFTVVYPDDGDACYVELAKDIIAALKGVSGITLRLVSDFSIPGADNSQSCEILVGGCAREEAQAALRDRELNEYGVYVSGRKIVVCGWNLTTVSLAADSLVRYIKLNYSSAAGTLAFDGGYSDGGRYTEWKTGIPDFTGGTLSGCMDCEFNNLLSYYTGTTAADYTAYLTVLGSAGYVKVYENEIKGNLFYCAKKEADDTVVYVTHTPCDGVTRLVTAPLSETVFIEKQAFTPVTDVKITQMMLDYGNKNIGMCYIVTLADGSFVVYDGGGSTNGDYDRLYRLLTQLNERTDGRIVIAGWILTHEHWDHYANFYEFCQRYSQKVAVEYFICNTPSYSVAYNADDPHYFMAQKYAAAAKSVPGMKLIKIHTGQPLELRGTKIEVLYTQEDLYPIPMANFNNSSLVTRIHAGNQTVMITADILKEGCAVMLDRYGSYLKSDIMQVAHHGYLAASNEFYTAVDPAVILWPNSRANAEVMSANKNGSSDYIQDFHLVNKLHVKECFVADEKNVTLTLPYTANSGAAVLRD